jgi:cytochrome bd-type quinol oxidase subunit 2
MIRGGQRVFYFRFSIFVLGLGFRPPGEKERKRKNEERKQAADMVCGGQGVFYFRFSIFVLGLGFRPPGEKKEERRTKAGCRHG